MRSKKVFLFLSAIFFVVFISCINKTSAQQNGSLYFSVGYNKAWFSRTKIHIEQYDLGNSYNMLNVPGDNKTKTAISPLQLNYRIGYYYNYEQTWGIEANFDPVNYRIIDGSILQIKGTINNTPNVNKKITFSAANGYYYYFNGANLLLINLVRRFGVFQSASNKIRIDILAKAGIGPVLPHFVNSLPIYPVADPQLQFGGWNAGAEGGVRVTIYRYAYFEFAGKYDFASFNALKVNDGSARQNLQTYEVIASIGFTFPTSKNNPLFRKEHKITTILPFYQQAKLLREGGDMDKEGKDSTDHNKFREVQPFQDILDKEAKEAEDKERRLHPPDTFTNADSLVRVDSIARVDSVMRIDSVAKQDSIDRATDSLGSKKERRRRKHHQVQDTVLNNAQQVNPDSVKQATTDSVNKNAAEPPVNKAAPEPPANKAEPEKIQDTTANSASPPGEEKLSKKEEKRKAKQEKKEAKQKEKEAAAEKARQEEEAKKKAQEEEDAKKKAEQEKADKEKQDNPDNKDGQ